MDYSKGIDSHDVLRAFWYMEHAAFEHCMDPDEFTQRQGIVVFNNMRGMSRANSRRETDKLISRAIQDILPVRVGALHFANQVNNSFRC